MIYLDNPWKDVDIEELDKFKNKDVIALRVYVLSNQAENGLGLQACTDDRFANNTGGLKNKVHRAFIR